MTSRGDRQGGGGGSKREEGVDEYDEQFVLRVWWGIWGPDLSKQNYKPDSFGLEWTKVHLRGCFGESHHLWLLWIVGIWAHHCDASTECRLLSYFGKHISWDLANTNTKYDRFTIGQLPYFAESMIMKSMADWKIVSHLRTHSWTHNAINITRKIGRQYGTYL